MKKISINNQIEIEEIINSCDACTLSMVDGDKPYAVPMNFAYENGIVYFHGAPFGRKLDILKNNPFVCISFYSDQVLNIRHENVACSYSMKFKSVLIHGEAEFVHENDEKVRILNLVMKKYAGRGDFTYSKPAIDNVNVFFVKAQEVTAFKRGY